MNRVEKRMEQLKKENKKAFITYTTAGLPDLDATAKLIIAQDEAGADVLEIGIPFSDPVADGPVIQNASYIAIQNGATISKIFETIKSVREQSCEIPIVFMMYYNTILHYGLEAFTKKCIECGVDGMIIPDLPFEEQEDLQKVLDKYENGPLLIQLISPVSKQRVPEIVKNTRGFVYCISKMGVTGKMGDFHKDIFEYLTAVKKVSPVPVMLGFGIREPKDIEPFAEVVDGAIVGTNLIRVFEESNYSVAAAKEYVAQFKKAVENM